MVHILPDGRIIKSVFWQLEQEGDTLHYRDEREYLEHFTSLMQESVKQATQSASSIAAELSAGMDSTAVYSTCAQLALNPSLFMHAPLPDSANARTYNDRYERAFMTQFPSAAIHRIMADNFDPIRLFKDYAEWFGGPPPYVFELFAHNIHRAVSSAGHTILLSGFGGDQGVSSHIPVRFILPLLHPKLLEFCLNLPLEQKRHQGIGRHLMRRYLAQVMPTAPFDDYKKKEGLDIMPATMDTFKAQWESGLFQNEFQSLPEKLTQDKSSFKAMIKTIQAFMLNWPINKN